MSRGKLIIKTVLPFFLIWIIVTILLYLPLVREGLLKLNGASFFRFVNSPLQDTGLESQQYGKLVSDLLQSSLGDSLSLFLPAFLLTVAILLLGRKNALPSSVYFPVKFIANTPFFWLGLIPAALAAQLNFSPTQNPVLPIVFTFIFLSSLSFSLLKKHTNYRDPKSQILFFSGAYLIYEVALTWPGLGLLLFNSLSHGDLVLTNILFFVLFTIILAINLFVSIYQKLLYFKPREG